MIRRIILAPIVLPVALVLSVLNLIVIAVSSVYETLTKECVKELVDMRTKVTEVTTETVMQKAISFSDFNGYMDKDSPKTQVTGCVSKAEDAAPYTTSAKEIYNNLRLDYNGTEFTYWGKTIEQLGLPNFFTFDAVMEKYVIAG